MVKHFFTILAFAFSIVLSAIPTSDTVTNSIGMKFKRIPAGTFEMGFEGRTLTAPYVFDGITSGFYNEHPRHGVRITRDFYMGVYEVTNAQYKAFRAQHGADIPWYGSGVSLPVHNVTWFGADSFCAWLTQNDPNGWTYRLPTEAEWEVACRAGGQTWFGYGDTLYATQANTGTTLQNIGLLLPNAYGLYDMHGNAREWCLDWMGPYSPDTAVNPGGRLSGGQKVIRGLLGFPILYRSAARGSHFPEVTTDPLLGFRVVISGLTRDSLLFAAAAVDSSPWQKRVAPQRPQPATLVSGAVYSNAEGLVFSRVALSRNGYPAQKDSIAYVSSAPITGDSAHSRKLAGAYAKRLSGTYGVLCRLSNRYEIRAAGQDSLPGLYFLTLLPDVAYSAGRPHPDVSFYLHRKTGAIAPDLPVGGPLYWKVNHNSYLAEWPNGDLVATWYSGKTEDMPEQNIACSRLRLGEDAWDDTASLCRDLSGLADYSTAYWDNGRGRLFEYWSNLRTGTYARYSDNLGQSWSSHRLMINARQGTKHLDRLNGDSVITVYDQSGGGGTVLLSLDGGWNWSLAGKTLRGIHPSHVLLDDGAIRVFKRSAPLTVDSGKSVMGSFSTRDLGQTWDTLFTPFTPPNIGQYDVVLKLHSGRLLVATYCAASGKSGVVLAESEDQGQTWFCRRKFGTNGGNGDYMAGYKDMCQTRDGLIHLLGTYGSGTGNGAKLPQASFSEQWLREGTCLDVADWGINVPGLISPCPDETTGAVIVETGFKPVSTITTPAQLTATPNPFNPVVRISVTGGMERPDVKIYNGAGVLVSDLSRGLAKGQSVVWDACRQPSGLYFAVLTVSGKRLVKSLVLVK